MKYVILFPLLLSVSFIFGQFCPSTGAVALRSQDELNDFFASYPNTTDFQPLRLSGDITDLSPMQNATKITHLTINAPNLTNLNGLQNLIETQAILLFNTKIENLNDLSSLKHVSCGFIISDNDELNDISQLGSLDSMNNLEIRGNKKLTDLNGFESFNSISSLIITNSYLTSFNGLQNIDTIYEQFRINGSNNLVNLEGLENLEYSKKLYLLESSIENLNGLNNLIMVEDFTIEKNENLNDISNLNSLNSVENFKIKENNNLELVQMGNQFIECSRLEINGGNTKQILNFNGIKKGEIVIQFSRELITIDGFTNLDSSLFTAYQNTNLKNIRGFNNFRHNVALSISENSALSNLETFDNIETMSALRISKNNFIEFNYFNTVKSIGQFTFWQDIDQLNGFSNLENVGDFNIYGSINEINKFPKLKRINGRVIVTDLNISNFSFLEEVTFIGNGFSMLDCNNIENLEGFGKLDTLLGGSSTNFTIIRCDQFRTTEFFKDKVFGPYQFIKIQECPRLENINGLSNITYTDYLWITDNPNLESLEGIKNLNSIYQGKLSSLFKLKSLQGLENLKTVGENLYLYNLDSIKNLNGLQNLESVGTDFNIDRCQSLTTLSELNQSIDIKGEIGINNNSQLTSCKYFFICNHLSKQRQVSFSGCNLQTTCDPNEFFVRSFYDQNQNGEYDEDELFIQNVPYTLNNGIFYPQSDNTPIYSLLEFPQLENILSFEPVDNWNLTTDSLSYFLDAGNLNSPYEFGFYPDTFYTSLQLNSFVSTIRCLSPSELFIDVSNNGTESFTGIIWIESNDNLELTNVEFDTIAGNQYGFKVDEMTPSNDLVRKFSFQVPGPPNISIGDNLTFNVWAYSTNQQIEYFSDTTEFAQEILCSYDPNDKLVKPAREDNFTLFEEELFYTIRFQNTGNAEAIDVVIRDTLDRNLDPSTFSLIGSSHDYVLKTSLKDEKFLSFSFNNIFLPDSTSDFTGSNGYVSYSIKPKPGLSNFTTVENTANIYFDFNPPIVTNTTKNILVDMFPTSVNALERKLDIELYPNPTAGNLIFSGNEFIQNSRVLIYGANGTLISKRKLQNNQLNVNALLRGIYFIRIIQSNGTQNFKILKQ